MNTFINMLFLYHNIYGWSEYERSRMLEGKLAYLHYECSRPWGSPMNAKDTLLDINRRKGNHYLADFIKGNEELIFGDFMKLTPEELDLIPFRVFEGYPETDLFIEAREWGWTSAVVNKRRFSNWNLHLGIKGKYWLVWQAITKSTHKFRLVDYQSHEQYRLGKMHFLSIEEATCCAEGRPKLNWTNRQRFFKSEKVC